jgi:hypothetical protein
MILHYEVGVKTYEISRWLGNKHSLANTLGYRLGPRGLIHNQIGTRIKWSYIVPTFTNVSAIFAAIIIPYFIDVDPPVDPHRLKTIQHIGDGDNNVWTS